MSGRDLNIYEGVIINILNVKEYFYKKTQEYFSWVFKFLQ